MRLHVEALYTYDERSRIESINQWHGGEPPRFYLARTTAGNLWRFHTSLPDELAHALHVLCKDEPAWNGTPQPPQHQHEYARLVTAHAPIRQISSGPAYWFSKDFSPHVQPVGIREANTALLQGGLDDWIADVPHRQPFMAAVEDCHAVSVCASVRITRAAHEAGVETLPTYRGRGHAVNVVAGWAKAVGTSGAVALYSTSWDNAASRRVAAKLGLQVMSHSC
jgi:hypothetical protein